jgi:hypothetical protein
MSELMRADRRLRRLTWVVVGIAVVVAVAAIALFHHWLEGVGETTQTNLFVLQIRRLIGIAVTGSAVCLALLAGYAAFKGGRTLGAGQWPAPGTRVLRDTVIRRGRDAMRIGRLMRVAALVLLVLAASAGAVSWRIFTLG